ncbi:CCA tRNA nucleotidyltransferase [Asticcacaulis sp. EMRT-3]|uniref:CCA tRNA nucleotidyltransferase n=1 Tax=Asticcacaulis sp. EMRT-3 TaxID=3040349 RepID=UPI0024AFA62D|nr:CCA tRNA nucleotidyltransferase [Asticcacaulis sp. EMRT-3]MDI7774887.1 CCA tRNA nucleotidyltransferase [Asticcacaulis sp. EMRT-3]
MTRIVLSDDMQAPATRSVFAALEALGGAGCVRFVGGCVRNALMQRPVSDLDLATQLTPDDTEAALKAAAIKSVPTGKAFGTITAVVNGKPFEITSLREDVETDGRRAVVSYTTDWARDALRRDFYLNALYADRDGTVYDPTGEGIGDALAGRVRFIGEAEQRIREDYLRILRFFRFSAGYARGIDADSLAACVALIDGIDSLSGERIQQEMLKILALPSPMTGLTAMLAGGLLPHILPGWRGDDLAVLASILPISAEPEPRLMALLDSGGLLEGTALKEVQARLKLSQRLYQRLKAVVTVMGRLHDGAEDFTRLMYRHGRQAVEDAVILSAAHIARPFADVQNLIEALRATDVPVFPLKGADLLALGMAAGPDLGAHLKRIEADWLDHDFSQSVMDAALDALRKSPK